MIASHGWSLVSTKPRSNETDSPLVGAIVEIHLCDHDPIEENVDCDSDEEGTMTAGTRVSKGIDRSERLEHTRSALGSSFQMVSAKVSLDREDWPR